MQRTPTDRHPHATCQRMLQEYDQNLWLVWIPKYKRWAVVYERPSGPVPTHRHLTGLPGVGATTRFEFVTMCWGPKREYLAPDMYAREIARCARLNDKPVSQRIAEVDAAEEQRKEIADQRTRAHIEEQALETFDTVGVNKTMSGMGGALSLDYAANRERSRLVRDAETGETHQISDTEFQRAMERSRTGAKRVFESVEVS